MGEFKSKKRPSKTMAGFVCGCVYLSVYLCVCKNVSRVREGMCLA